MEVSEEKANQRVEVFKLQLSDLKVRLYEVERRAIIAEKMMTLLQKELDTREGIYIINWNKIILHLKKKKYLNIPDKLFKQKEQCKYICDDLDSTFAELTGY